MAEGAGVVTSRADVDTIVTEHGMAELHGKSIQERIEALIAIADPRFRDELDEAAKVDLFYARRGPARPAPTTSGSREGGAAG